MKLLVDMKLSPRWVDLLTRSQFEAAHWSTVSSPHALDEEIMGYAAKHDYVVLTKDLDFGAILAVTHGEKPSVVQIRSEDLNPDVSDCRRSRRCDSSPINSTKAHSSTSTRYARA